MRERKYLLFYEKCMVTGKMPMSGLCSSLGHDSELRDLFKPELARWSDYWASEDGGDDTYVFNELRQTIILLLAAMNREL